ncbi:MAG: cadherin repeat domain-containing protein [Muricauda sp.]|nr:cadherin repeat domain-containing protein [Allomuricauda sp.]
MSKKNKLSYLFLLTVLLLTYSCSNDDDTTIKVNLEGLEVTIDENPADGETIGTIQTDEGMALNLNITSQTPSGALNIDSGSGEVTVADASLFDFETNPTITATVTAENSENSANITINLNNVAEVSAQNLEVTLDENPVDGQVIGSVQVTGNASGFSLASQSPAGAMNIDSNTGELTVADASLFDYETNPTLTATVSIVDAENPVTVTIDLNDVVELSAQDLTTDMDENPTDGQIVGTIQGNGSGTLSFSITSQTPTGALSIDAGTGELSVVDPNLFDFETNPVITATILVDNGAETATATVTINLNDVDEVAAQNTDLTLDENPSNGDVIGALQASGSNLSYAITFQNPAGAFSIDQNTGELSVADETLFDFETNPNMLATISVSNGTQSVSANAFVALNDVNEIGEYKFGGVIFWVNPTGDEGLVIALTNQSSSSTWGCSGVLTGAAGATIGTGETNTTAIISAGCATSGTAAELVSNLSLNGYDDWFLPSSDEWIEVYNNLSIIKPVILSNGGDDFLMQYWSSTENDAYNAEFIVFSGPAAGTIYSYLNKTSAASTRAIRAWTDF